MSEESKFLPGTTVYLSQFPCDSASFAVVLKTEAWRRLVARSRPDRIENFEQNHNLVPLRILGRRYNNFEEPNDEIEPFSDSGLVRYTYGTVNAHMEIVDIAEAMRWCYRLSRFGREINGEYFSEVATELKFLNDYLGGKLATDSNNELPVNKWGYDWAKLFRIYRFAIPIAHYPPLQAI